MPSTNQINEELVKEFKQKLRFGLLSDNYGGWKKLPPDFFDKLCDRIFEEVEEFILEYSHERCETHIEELEAELNMMNEDLTKAEDRASDITKKHKEFVSGIAELMEKVKL